MQDARLAAALRVVKGSLFPHQTQADQLAHDAGDAGRAEFGHVDKLCAGDGLALGDQVEYHQRIPALDVHLVRDPSHLHAPHRPRLCIHHNTRAGFVQ